MRADVLSSAKQANLVVLAGFQASGTRIGCHSMETPWSPAENLCGRREQAADAHAQVRDGPRCGIEITAGVSLACSSRYLSAEGLWRQPTRQSVYAWRCPTSV